jgi:hypothetical protein
MHHHASPEVSVPFPTIDQAFIKQYEAEVHEAYQRQGSKLRGTVRTKSGVQGSSTFFPRVGTGTAVTKARNAEIAAMNVGHSQVECVLQDWYAGDWVDRLDELKTNIDERGVIVRAGAWALGRKTDELIITALDTTATAVANGAGDLADSAGLTKAKVLRALNQLGTADVPDDGMRFAIVPPSGWEDLMLINEFVSSDFVGADLPFRQAMGQMAKSWLGCNWIMHPGCPTPSAGVRRAFIYHMSSIGHAIGAEISTDITWHGDRASHFVNNMMSQGAVAIDTAGAIRITFTE